MTQHTDKRKPTSIDEQIRLLEQRGAYTHSSEAQPPPIGTTPQKRSYADAYAGLRNVERPDPAANTTPVTSHHIMTYFKEYPPPFVIIALDLLVFAFLLISIFYFNFVYFSIFLFFFSFLFSFLSVFFFSSLVFTLASSFRELALSFLFVFHFLHKMLFFSFFSFGSTTVGIFLTDRS